MRFLCSIVAIAILMFSGQLQAQTFGCGGGFPDPTAYNSFVTTYAGHYNSNYVSDMKVHYDSIDPANIESTCKDELDQAWSCCMNLDSCGSYQGTFLASTGETSDVALRAQTVNASLEVMNAKARGSSICQLKRESCSSTCAQGQGMVGNTKAKSICDGIITSEHYGNQQAQQNLASACTSLQGLNRAAAGGANYSVICLGDPTPCQLQGN